MSGKRGREVESDGFPLACAARQMAIPLWKLLTALVNISSQVKAAAAKSNPKKKQKIEMEIYFLTQKTLKEYWQAFTCVRKQEEDGTLFPVSSQVKDKIESMVALSRLSGSLLLNNLNMKALPILLKDCLISASTPPSPSPSTSSASSPYTDLVEVDLMGNNLISLPRWTSGVFRKVKVLWLTNNNLVTLPNCFEEMKSLKKISLSHNQFKRLPPSLTRCTSLVELHLDHNRIRWVTPEINNLTRLETLWLSHNSLSTLPNLSCVPLHELLLDHNNFATLPRSILGLKTILHLSFTHNSITTLPRSLVALPIKKLGFEENPLLAPFDSWIDLTVVQIFEKLFEQGKEEENDEQHALTLFKLKEEEDIEVAGEKKERENMLFLFKNAPTPASPPFGDLKPSVESNSSFSSSTGPSISDMGELTSESTLTGPSASSEPFDPSLESGDTFSVTSSPPASPLLYSSPSSSSPLSINCLLPIPLSSTSTSCPLPYKLSSFFLCSDTLSLLLYINCLNFPFLISSTTPTTKTRN